MDSVITGWQRLYKMHYKPNVEERKYLRQIVSENKVWIKNAREGPASLMRALSSALYFTESRHAEIQAVATDFVLQNYRVVQFKSLKPNDSAAIIRFSENPELSEFSTLNIEAVSMAYQGRIKLFYVQNNNFCSQVFYKKTSKSCSIFRFNELFYAAVFDKKYKELADTAQNFVLSVVTAALERAPFEYRNHNKGHLINYDYTASTVGGPSSKKGDSEKTIFFDYSFNKSDLSLTDLSYSFRLSENNSTNSNSVEFYIEGLSSMLRNRHGLVKESSSEASDKLPESRLEFLRSHAQQSNPKNESKLISKELLDFSIFAEPESVVNNKNKFSSFANKVMCENNNLQREVTALPIGNLFEFNNINPNNQSMSSKQSQSVLEQGEGLLFGDDDATLREPTQDLQSKSEIQHPMVLQVIKPESSNLDCILQTTMLPILHPKQPNTQFSLMDSFQPILENLPQGLKPTKNENKKECLQSAVKHKANSKQNIRDEAEADPFDCPNEDHNNVMDERLAFKLSESETLHEKCEFDPNLSVHEGTLAYYDEKKGFGIIQPRQQDLCNRKQGIFVFRKELQKAGINVRVLNVGSHETQLKLVFQLERISDFSSQRTRAVNIARLENSITS